MNALANSDDTSVAVPGKTPDVSTAEVWGRKVAILTIDSLAVSVSGRLLKIAKVRDEPYDCLSSPEGFVKKLRELPNRPDLFTFMQPVGDQQPHHPFYYEPETLAVLRVTTYQNWWKKQIRSHTRNHIRKSQNKGVEVRQVPFDDDLVWGVKAIYDECPVRQGRPFWHYRKDFSAIKEHLATFLDRTDFIGAFCEGKMIGYTKMTSGNGAAGLMQILSRIGDRDKAPTNALIAKAVELCVEKRIPYLHYALWGSGNFALFKENHAFERYDVPRYFVPLTTSGRLMLKLGLHRKLVDQLPPKWRKRLVVVRNHWNAFRYKIRSTD